MEKLTIETRYYTYGINDLLRAIRTCQLWAATYPRDWVPWQILANDYNDLNQTTEAIEAAEHALRMEQNRGNIYNVLIRAYKAAGRYNDALRLGQEATRRHLDSDAIHAFLFEAALDANDREALQRETAWGDAHGGWFFIYVRAKTEAAVGKLRQANASFERSRAMAASENLDETADDILIDQAQLLYDLGMMDAARATGKRIAKVHPDSADLALLYAELGNIGYAQRFLRAHQSQTSDTLLTTRSLPEIRAAVAMAERKPADAIAALEPTREFEHREYPVLTARGRAYMLAGKADLSANEYRALLEGASSGTDLGFPLYSLAHVALARAYAVQAGQERRKQERV
jgi:tetratricopeptide (TPR) repeat protein